MEAKTDPDGDEKNSAAPVKDAGASYVSTGFFAEDEEEQTAERPPERRKFDKLRLAIVFGILILLVAGALVGIKGLKNHYDQAALDYRGRLKQTYTLISHNINQLPDSATLADAADLMIKSADLLATDVALAPKQPKLLFIPLSTNSQNNAGELTKDTKELIASFHLAADLTNYQASYDGYIATAELPPPSTATDPNVARQTAWRKAASSIKALSVPKQVRSIHNDTLSKLDSIDNIVIDMIDSHNLGNQFQYQANVDKLAAAMNDLTKLHTDLTGTVTYYNGAMNADRQTLANLLGVRLD